MNPSEFESVKFLLSTFGGAGFAFVVALLTFKRWTATLEQKDDQFKQRIAALEKASDECSRDRTNLHMQMFELQKGVISANTEILHKVFDKLQHVTPIIHTNDL